MREFTIGELKTVFHNKGYKWLDDGKEDHLNIIGIRAKDLTANKFNDAICVVYNGKKADGTLIPVIFQFTATTDPGLYWLNNPGSAALGTAILVEGQYLDSWELGLHQGKYKAFKQIKSVKLYRDVDRDSQLDLTNIKDSGLVGINIHRANEMKESIQVDKWSAGCQVISHPKNFNLLIRLAESSQKIRGNKFSYTLLKETDLD